VKGLVAEGKGRYTKGEAESGLGATEAEVEAKGKETGGREVGKGVGNWEGSDHPRDHEVGRG